MPRLPPVDISPQTRLRARFCPGVICSAFTFFQSHSSSSATSWTKPVIVPCPISERATRITQVLSGLTTTHALTSVAVASAVFESAAAISGRWNPSASPPLAAAELTINLRRERLVLSRIGFFMVDSSCLDFGYATVGGNEAPDLGHAGRHMHGRADALISTAAADIGHRFVDVLVTRPRIFLEQRRGSHDLPRLTVAALGNVDLRPRLLHRVRARGRQALDGDDLVGGFHASDRDSARALDLAVDMHRARAALRDAAPIFSAGKAHLLADEPQERRVRLHLYVVHLAIDVELCHERPPAT